jgi:hypothetical protein
MVKTLKMMTIMLMKYFKKYKFMFKGTVDASIDARNNLNEIRKLCVELRSSILKQREDNQSDYS